MNIVVIDDEVNSRQLMKTLLSEYCNESSVHIADTIQQALEIINQQNPDLIFLDIELKGETGFDLLDRFKEADFLVCFATGYENYAMKAIKYGAFGYLLKPIDIDELVKIVEKARIALQKKVSLVPENEKSLIISENEKYWVVKYSEILQIESSGNYTYIHTNKEKILSAKKLNYYEDLLPKSLFHRTHRSHIVNLALVKHIRLGRTGLAILMNDQEVPIASRRLKELHVSWMTLNNPN